MKISHVFIYKGYTKSQRLKIWLLCMLRNLTDVFVGIVNLITINIFVIDLSLTLTEKILKSQIEFYKQNNK